MRRRGFTLIEMCAVIAVFFLLVFVFFPRKSTSYRNRDRAYCTTNLKQLGIALAQYAVDSGDSLPFAVGVTGSSSGPEASPYGWADSIQPYLSTLEVFQCPAQGESSSPPAATMSGYTDYWFNRQVNQLTRSLVPQPELTVALVEGNDGVDVTDARYSKTVIPNLWRRNQHSPIWRHLDGGNYLFVDGHVKWYRANRVQNQWVEERPSLAPGSPRGFGGIS